MKLGKIVCVFSVIFLFSLVVGFAFTDYLLSKPSSHENSVDTSSNINNNNKSGSNTGNDTGNSDSLHGNHPGESKKQPGGISLTKKMNILLVGIDSGLFPGGGVRNEIGRTDTIILTQVNPEEKKIYALSIPRDTLVEIPGRGPDKVNHAYTIGGMALTIETIEKFTGVKIDKYVKLDYQGFAYLIDAVGGVEMDVEKDIQSGNYLIKKGRQVLDGEHAYALIRHRKEPLGDISRVKRQQQMAKALFRQIRERTNLIEITIMALKFKEHITTDLDLKDMILLVNTVQELHEQDIELTTLPGTFYDWKGISYWKPDERETEIIMENFK